MSKISYSMLCLLCVCAVSNDARSYGYMTYRRNCCASCSTACARSIRRSPGLRTAAAATGILRRSSIGRRPLSTRARTTPTRATRRTPAPLPVLSLLRVRQPPPKWQRAPRRQTRRLPLPLNMRLKSRAFPRLPLLLPPCRLQTSPLPTRSLREESAGRSLPPNRLRR